MLRRFVTNPRMLFAMCVIATIAVVVVAVSPDRYSRRGRAFVKRQWLIITGRLIDVGGHRLRIDCWGDGPTVVFDAGLNQRRESWGTVPEGVSQFARVCTYERAGIGDSEHAGFVRTSADVVRELKTLLEKAGENGPYMLVGHSFGGMNARLFAAQFHDEVFALVLIDPTHEDEYQTLNHLRPEHVRISDRDLMRGNNPERLDLLSSHAMVKKISAPPIPATVILSATLVGGSVTREERELHGILQLDTARKMRANHVFVDSGHLIQLERPQIVIDAIRAALVERH